MLDTLAHSPDPYPTYAELREKGVHQHDDGRWVVSRAADVAAVLAAPAAVVGVAAADPAQAAMARFSDGADHDRRRALGVERLAAIEPQDLRTTARALTHGRLGDDPAVEVMGSVARDAPVAALAQALGARDLDAAVAATGDVARALTPPSGDVTSAAGPLAALLGHDLDETGVNVLALLFQAFDACAGLIGNALLSPRRTEVDVDGLLEDTVWRDPSVQLTTRVAAAPLTAGGVTIPAGDRIVVLLAAANHDPDGDAVFTFGGGARPCPGEAHALALAAGVLDALTGDVAGTPITYEPRPNLRIPVEIVMMR